MAPLPNRTLLVAAVLACGLLARADGAGGLRRRRTIARADAARDRRREEEDAAFASVGPFGRRLPGSMSMSGDELAQHSADEGSMSLAYAACLTEADCRTASEARGIAAYYFFTGDHHPSKGCVTKNDKVFFSPGTEAQMSEADLPGIRERLWC